MGITTKRPKPVVGGVLVAVDAVLLQLVSLSYFVQIMEQRVRTEAVARSAPIHAHPPTFYLITSHPISLLVSLFFAVFVVLYNARAIGRAERGKGWWIAFVMISCLILLLMLNAVYWGLTTKRVV